MQDLKSKQTSTKASNTANLTACLPPLTCDRIVRRTVQGSKPGQSPKGGCCKDERQGISAEPSTKPHPMKVLSSVSQNDENNWEG